MRALTLLVALTAAHVASSEETGPSFQPTVTPADDGDITFAPTGCTGEERAARWFPNCPCDYMAYSYWYNTDYDPAYTDLTGDRPKPAYTENYPVMMEGKAIDIVGFWGIDGSNVFEGLMDYKGKTEEWGDEYPGAKSRGMLTNGVVMEKTAEMCGIALKQLKLDLAGRHGVVNIQNIYEIMCSQYCLISDELHIAAMRVSTCNCLELSTQPTGKERMKVIGGELQWHVEGDFCLRNSARMLCDVHEICGVWDCDIADFSCPRHEWEHGESKVRGEKKSNLCSAAGRGASPPRLWGAILIAVLAIALPAVGVGPRAR